MILHKEALPFVSPYEGWRGRVAREALFFPGLLHRFRLWVCPCDIRTSSSSWTLMGCMALPFARCEGPDLVPGFMCTVTQMVVGEAGCLGSPPLVLLVALLHEHS